MIWSQFLKVPRSDLLSLICALNNYLVHGVNPDALGIQIVHEIHLVWKNSKKSANNILVHTVKNRLSQFNCYRFKLSLLMLLWMSMRSSLFCRAFFTWSLTSLKPAARLFLAWSLLASFGLQVAKSTSFISSSSLQPMTVVQREVSRSTSSLRRFLSRQTGLQGTLR